jgi:hypothetical protein
LKAWLNLRHSVPERLEAFTRGLERFGYSVVHGATTRPGNRDILVTWNRIREGAMSAEAFESRGRPVLVAENASWGNEFMGQRWYVLARGSHNLAGGFESDGPERWDGLGVELAPWRRAGELVILAQRGIGPTGVAMPLRWPELALKRFGGRVRAHPGTGVAKPLEEDLANCGRAVTWGSGAAIRALVLGIPVTSELPGWIGQQDNTDAGRLDMFRRLAWAQWRLAEIASGEPFERLLA